MINSFLNMFLCSASHVNSSFCRSLANFDSSSLLFLLNLLYCYFKPLSVILNNKLNYQNRGHHFSFMDDSYGKSNEENFILALGKANRG